MKKHRFYIKIMCILAVVFVVGIVPCGLEAKASVVDSGTCGAVGNEENVIWKYDSDGVLTVSGQGAMMDCEADAQPWVKYKNTTNRIVIGEGITCIGRNAFSKFKETELELPKYSLKEIKSDAFYENKLLKELHLPETVTELGYSSFWQCESLSEVEIPGSIKKISGWAFSCCFGVKNFIVHEGVVSTEDSFFWGGNNTERIYLPETLAQTEGKFDITFMPNLVICGKSDAAQKFAFANDIPYLDLIRKHDIGNADIEIKGEWNFIGGSGFYTESEWPYTGNEVRPNITVKYTLDTGKEIVLQEGREYQVSYTNNNGIGTATATVTGMDYFSGKKSVNYDIYMPMDNANIKAEVENRYMKYDGTEKKPKVKVTCGGNVLKEGIDYSITYYNNVNPGTAKATVTGLNFYKGSKDVLFEIAGISINDADITLNETIFTYDGSPKKPSVEVKYNGIPLRQGIDYAVSYTNNVDAGTGYAIIEGTGIYTGAVSMSFTILPYSAGKESVYSQGDTFLSGNFVYEVMDDEELEVEVSSTSKKNLTKAVIPATIKCEGITYKVTSIGQKAFYKNTKIKSVEVGNNVTSIENYAFYGCKNMTSLKLGKKVEVIGSSAFRKCTKLTAVTLPKSMEELGKNAFYGCSKLKTITINANSVIDIEEGAIKGISNKAVIKVPKKHYKKYQKKLTGRTGYKKKTMKLKKK